MLWSIGVLSASLAGCGGSAGTHAATLGRATPATARLSSCPVTHANGSTPPGEQPTPEYHGNGALWTALPPDGHIVATRQFLLPDGSIEIKFPWFGSRRAGAHLRIVGSSQEPPGLRVRASISDGMTHAPHFWASGITFPKPGCWHVTGSAGRARLSLVVLVTKAGV
jgi:hypothetical protein